MTYLEIYESCKTKEDLAEQFKKDLEVAVWFLPYKLEIIEEAINIVLENRPVEWTDELANINFNKSLLDEILEFDKKKNGVVRNEKDRISENS